MLAINHVVEPRLLHVMASAGAEAICNTMRASGAAIVKRAIAPSLAGAVERALRPWFAATPPGEGLFLGRKTRRFSGVFAKAPVCAELAGHSLVLSIVEALLGLGRACDAIQLNLTQAIAIDPGQGGQLLHRDDTAFPFAHDFELMVNAMWPIDAFTEENGATKIVPGSHRWDRTLRPAEDDAIAAIAQPGDVIVWLGSVLHGGGANRSNATRRGLVFSYSLGWLAQAEKLLLSTPPDVARALPERVQRLIGYQVHRPNLGWIEERDPLGWLKGETAAVAAAQDNFPPDLQARLEAALGAMR